MSAFVYNGIFHARKSIENHCTATAFDIVEGGLGKGHSNCKGDGVAVDSVESGSHGEMKEVEDMVVVLVKEWDLEKDPIRLLMHSTDGRDVNLL